MPATIIEYRRTQRVAETLIEQRQNARTTALGLQGHLATYPGAGSSAYALAGAKSFAANLKGILDTILAGQAEIEAAATAAGMDVQDFLNRYGQLRQVETTWAGATTANIAARLQAVADALPAETLL